MIKDIPAPTLQRLPLYYRELRLASQNGTEFLSSQELGNRVGVPAVQVRKDLSNLAEQGRPGVGYHTTRLADYLERYLGLNRDKRAVLVGAGNLGRALALFPGFGNYGMQIVALFDKNPDVIGTQVGDLVVRSITELGNSVKCLNVPIGIITTPAEAAQTVAEAMIRCGIRAIWNFSPCKLEVEDGIFVRNEDLAAQLSVLSHHVQKMRLSEDENSR